MKLLEELTLLASPHENAGNLIGEIPPPPVILSRFFTIPDV